MVLKQNEAPVRWRSAGAADGVAAGAGSDSRPLLFYPRDLRFVNSRRAEKVIRRRLRWHLDQVARLGRWVRLFELADGGSRVSHG